MTPHPLSGPGTGGTQADSPIVVDARGLLCPEPVIRLARAARSGVPAARVLADDPAARTDIPAFARLRGHDLAAVTDEGDHTAYLVRFVRPTPAAAEPAEPS